MEREWRCKKCETLLGVERGAHLHLRYKQRQYVVVEHDGTIADNKAYRKRPYQEDLDKDLQFTIYALGFLATCGEIEAGLRMDAIIKTKNPKAVQFHTRRTNSDCRWVLGLIEQVGKAITSGIFYPNPNGRHCTPRFCGYWSRCMGRKNGR